MRRPSLLYERHRFPGEIIGHAVWRYDRFLLSRTGGSPSPSGVNMAPVPVPGDAVGGHERSPSGSIGAVSPLLSLTGASA